MQVTITKNDLHSVVDRGTMWTMTGTGPDGESVTFAGDWRPMRDMCAAAEAEGEVTAEVENWQIISTVPLRRAVIDRSKSGSPSEYQANAYLPFNYIVTGVDDRYVHIAGHDDAGWTLDDYVIPRLASGLYSAREIKPGMWPCGCLENEAGAHRVGCPEHPEGVRA
jgi:hypothetical protein